MPVDNTITVDMNGTTVNCSLYALTEGFLSFTGNEFISDKASQIDDKFPVYYITNCSQDAIQEYLKYGLSSENSTQSWDPKYGFVNDGDAFVALIFTIGGTCITCWMLCVFLLLSPSHKRKPIMTQISTVFNTIVLTILMTKVTDAARVNYYSDTINVVNIHNVFYANLTFRVTNVLSEALILVSFLQIIRKIIQRKFKFLVTVISIILVIGYVVSGIVCEVSYRTTIDELAFGEPSHIYIAWHQARNALKLVYNFWIALLLLNYTLIIKSPRKYSHNKKLFPLAIFIWILFAIHLACCILMVGVFQNNWQNRSWLSIFPNIIEIGILSLVWEWIYDIRSLERRFELLGVLGRRISLEDVISFNSRQEHPKKEGYLGNSRLLTWIKNKISGYPIVNVYVESENNLKLQSSSNTSSDGPTLAVPGVLNNDDPTNNDGNNTYNNDNNNNNINDNNNNNINDNNVTTNFNSFTDPSYPADDHGLANSLAYEVQYIDDYDIHDHIDEAGPSSFTRGENPPPFEPAPGFNRDDYWPDKMP